MSITKEQLTEMLGTDVGKEVLNDLIEDQVKGLKSKNEELLSKVQSAKTEKDSLTERLQALENANKNAKTDKIVKDGDVEALRKALTDEFAEKENGYKDQMSKLQNQLHRHVTESELTQALIDANVSKPFMGAAKALIQSSTKAEVSENSDGIPFARFDGKAVKDFVKEWASTDSGKHFVSADANSGGDTNKTNGSGKAANGNKQTMKRSEFDALSPVEKRDVSFKGVQLVAD